MSLTSIQNEIQKLEPAERARLIDLLWDSLDAEHVKQIEAKWSAESEDRINAFERGEVVCPRVAVCLYATAKSNKDGLSAFVLCSLITYRYKRREFIMHSLSQPIVLCIRVEFASLNIADVLLLVEVGVLLLFAPKLINACIEDFRHRLSVTPQG